MSRRTLCAALIAAACILSSCGGKTVPAPPEKPTGSASPFDAHVAPMPLNAPLTPSAMIGGPLGRKPQSADRRPSSEAWNWNPIAANASQVAIAPDGTLWALANNGPGGADKYIWHYSGGGWHNIPGYGIQIAVGPDGSVWDVTSSGAVWHYAGGNWSTIGGVVSSITVDRAGNVWATATSNGDVWEFVNGSWRHQAGFGVRVASNPDNSLYVLSNTGVIWNAPAFGGYSACLGSGAVDIAPKPGGLGFYVLSGPSGGMYQVWDFTMNTPGDCAFGSYNATGWLASSVSFLGNTLAVVSNGNIYTTIANMPQCTVPLSGGDGYAPCDLQSAYNLPSATAGVGRTVAVVDAYDDPNAESDLAVYRNAFGLPPCTTANGCFRKVSQTGTAVFPAPNTNWAGEISLDVDMVSAICPNCHILLVEANSNASLDLAIGVNEAVSLGATEVSGSFSGSEFSNETSLDPFYNHAGIPIVVSTGDAGYGPRYPATSPYVVAAGGTALAPSSSLRGWSETAWGFTPNLGGSTSFSAGGSGCSGYEAKPSWQSDGGCSMRVEADISAVADLNTGVAIYDTYNASGWITAGGTSVSAPIIASVFALGGSVGPSPTAYLYSHADQLWNITNGTNGPCPGVPQYFCFAGVGYNGPTGLGTPNGLGAFGGASIASGARMPLSEPERLRLAQSVVSNPTIVRMCPEPSPGYMQCDGLLRLSTSRRRLPQSITVSR